MGKIKSDSVGNVAGVKISATEKAAFYYGDALFGFRECESGSRPSWAATNNCIVVVVFFTHLYIILSRF